MEKVYNPKDIEDGIYREWEKSGFFNPDKVKGQKSRIKDYRKRQAFSMVMPPPNVTGTLHIGHAVVLTLEDIMVRYHRMMGDDTLWLPGTDHAAIATQTKVEKLLKEKEGKSRHDLGRVEFLKRVEEFTAESKATIHKQIRKMGSSCDWSREAYTLDKVRSRAVREVFKKMYDDGLIYRGLRIVNWCPRCASTLADDEVEYKEQEANLYTFKYSKNFPVSISTTRPETKLGDTAVAVNPADKRYKNLLGKEFDVDFVGQPLHLKIIADRGIDMNFGTGAVGVTPAHSFIDYEMAQKNKLKIIQVINEEGRIVNAPQYQGLIATESRQKIVAKLASQGLLEKEEIIKNNLSVCYRCGASIEPLPSKQWFISVSAKFKVQSSKIKGIKKGQAVSLKDLAITAVKNGQIKIFPERFNKVYFEWMKNLRDWCISRQIWFGHRLPVWYKQKSEARNSKSTPMFSPYSPTSRGIGGDRGGQNPKSKLDEEIYIGIESPKGSDWVQDPDTLDTWFSSGLWTFSTLLDKDFEKYKNFGKWLQKSPDLKRFHPTSVMETGYDILFFWVARMILMTTYVLGEIPFKTVYLHGLVRDEKGRKMSKSLGNVIDPLTVAEKYGTDAVRLSLVLGAAAGNDLTLSEEKIAGFRNFTNKLWNIGRYVLSQTEEQKNRETKEQKVSKFFGSSVSRLCERWILSRLNSVIAEVTEDLENFRFSQAGEKLRSFTWDEFADWYIEISKVEKNFQQLSTINQQLLKLWHPFMPFVTEKLWEAAGGAKFLMIADWPIASKKLINKKAGKDFALIQEIIRIIRNLRAEFKIDPALFVKVAINAGAKKPLLGKEVAIIKHLARLESVKIVKSGEKPERSISAVYGGCEIYLILEGLVDFEKEKERIQKELDAAKNYLAGLENKLKNKDFISRAPKEIVGGEKLKLKETQEKIRKLKDYFAGLKNF